MEIQDASVLITGGASGLGAATARHLADRGARVTLADLDAERGQALADELGGQFVAADVRDEDAVQAAVDAAAAQDGGLRICVACAGIGPPVKLAGKRGPHPLAGFEGVIGVNLTGTFNAWRLAAQAMLANTPSQPDGERGLLVGTASVAAYEGQVGQVAYAASKGGIVGMTLPAARDLAPSGIRVNAIAPGLFDTPLLGTLPAEARASLGQQVPYPPRLGDPAEYAMLVEQLAVNRMLNGTVIRLDGAIRMAPR